MAVGTVKWFNSDKGFGFIVPDGGTDPDVFVHYTAIADDGFRELDEGQRVQYETVHADRGMQASDVRVIA
ncbi:cold-shock protein [Nocardia noduli]|uniref:cold-shock protein n=1 Tax=Nocardia noduli TaxID=2815722 RepID=UPI001C247293|nr:cold-shock protein [Nocardia noduli]